LAITVLHISCNLLLEKLQILKAMSVAVNATLYTTCIVTHEVNGFLASAERFVSHHCWLSTWLWLACWKLIQL